ncbi:protein ALP1-like [Dendronephthya gigantea]|uniref:protein ALP1-like n=1 Tax=Dendronephthya gigantea TaxID=151771 RepID=UPI00106A0A8A|nr:protein ALP1-like [Dendronephthya gigantea]
MKAKRISQLRRNRREIWFKKGRTDQWWNNLLGGRLADEEWQRNFRLTRAAFFELEKELRMYISPDPSSPNYRALSAEKKLAITLYYLKDSGSLRMTANTFGVHVCTVSKTIYDVCRAITYRLGPTYIKLPQNEEQMRKKVAEFEAKYGCIQAFGCIDGTHVAIKRPTENSQDYYCYKGFFSLNVQGVCDYRGQFMDVDCRWPGSVHDAKVFANSIINRKLRDGELPMTYQHLIKGGSKVGCYLIGDPAYPLTPYCMKEYQTCTSNSQVIFNNILRSARNPVECAFGRLKARWRFLTKQIDLNLDLLPTVVYACFVLHNFCEQKNCFVDQELVQQQYEVQINNQQLAKNVPHHVFSGNLDEGDVIRNIITSYIEKNLTKQ